MEYDIGVLPQKATTDWHENGFGLFLKEKIMQFTGLKDKNGKEIYEGDFVAVLLGETQEIGWSGSCWTVGEKLLGSYESELLEVIGNIYEDPELLK